MRVIAGNAKGRILKAPPGLDTRPVTDFIKEAIFNVIGPYLNGKTFLDLFSGSGSMGIEAKSRGASKVVLVENDHRAIKVIRQNLQNCNFDQEVLVVKGDVFKVVSQFTKEQFDYVYIDPPFKRLDYYDKLVKDTAVLTGTTGTIIIRSPKNYEMVVDPESPLTVLKRYSYGESVVNYLVRKMETQI